MAKWVERPRLAAYLVLVAAPLTVSIPGCDTHPPASPPDPGAPPAQGAAPDEHGRTAPRVSISNFKYEPATLAVAPGTRVVWTNRDDMPHTVTSPGDPRLLDSAALDTDDEFSFVFDRKGTFDYFCTIHPKMTGQVIVK